MTQLREAALAYARRGWAVFPLQRRSKEPAVAGAYKAATTDVGQVSAWWQRWPEANIGLATGAVSGLWVLDIDGPEGEASFAALVGEHGGELAETLMASTGKGHHLYWRLPPGVDQGRRIGVRPGLDIIGSQGYLVAPPSIHPSGRLYVWCDADHDLEVAPDWLLTLDRAKAPRTAPQRVVLPRMRPDGVGASEGIQDARRYLAGVVRRAVADVMAAGQGTRNATLYRSAVWVASVAAGLRADPLQGMADLYRAGLAAGLGDEEVERTIDSAANKGAANPEVRRA